MIFGVGTDLVVIERVRAMLDRHGVRMARRILALAELAEFEVAHDPARFLAKRFAAKEALAKAAGTGMRAPLHLSAIGVRHNGLGRPELFFSDELAAWLRERGVVRSHLSLSDEQGHALAFVVLEAE